MKKTVLITAGLSFFSLVGAHLYGRALHVANPDGILLYTPAVGDGPPWEPAYPLGFLLGGGGLALCAFFASLSFYIAARFFWHQLKPIAGQILVSSLLTGVVVFLAVLFVDVRYATYPVG